MDEHRTDMVRDWSCLVCKKVYRAMSRMPKYCSGCGFSLFRESEIVSLSRPERISSPPEPSLSHRLTRDSRSRLATPIPSPGRERRGARRVKPQSPLQIQFPSNKPLALLDISTSGLAVEHQSAFKFGSNYEAEISRSGQTIQLRLQVVRSVVSPTLGKEGSAIRYRTAFQILHAPSPAFFNLIPELCEAL